MRGVRTVLVAGGRRLHRRRQHRRRLRAHRAARGAHLLARRGCARDARRATRSRAFQGNYSAARRDAGGAQEAAQVPGPAHARCATCPSFNIGGGNFEIDFSIHGPDLVALARYTEGAARARRASSAASSTPTPRSSSTGPSCACMIDRERAADLGVRTEDIATALRLMVGGDDEVSRFRDAAANENYDVQLRLTERDRDRRRRDRRLLRAALGRASAAAADGAARRRRSRLRAIGPRAARQPGAHRASAERRRASIGSIASAWSSLRAGVGPGYALADRLEALRGAVARDGPARRVHDAACAGAAPSSSAPSASSSGRSAVDRVHVHDPGVAVREPDPPVHDPALAAAVGAVRAAQPVGDRQHAQSVLGARHARAVRRGEEELDPAGRSHEQAARGAACRARRRSCRPTATGCGRS